MRSAQSGGKESARLGGARGLERCAALVLRRLHHRKVRADPLHRFRVRVQSVLNDLDRSCNFERRLFNKHPSDHGVSFDRYGDTLRRAAAPPLPPARLFFGTSVESWFETVLNRTWQPDLEAQSGRNGQRLAWRYARAPRDAGSI